MPDIHVKVNTLGNVIVDMDIDTPSVETELECLVPATEYMMYLVATKSRMGFEAALDKLFEGAMDWSTNEP